MEATLEIKEYLFKKGNKLCVGRKYSPETIKKMSEARKGKPGTNKGKKFSEEHIKNMSLSRLGKKASIETRKKMSNSRLGEKNPAWKGGVTPENDRIRHSLEVEYWKKVCLERDNYTCQKTGQIGGQLEVHHINNFADFPELRTSIENGITLSKKAHLNFHKIYGKRNNTREQLEEFLRDSE